MSAGDVGVFCQNVGIAAYILENYSILKINFYLTMAALFK